jgi:plastocyanin
MTAKDMMHDLNIDELGVDGDVVKAGESTTITFTADTVGEFEYYCSVGQHRKNGQVGKLIVTE